MSSPRRILYLHGFASSPHSRKASFLAARLRQLGSEVEIPALDQNDFEHVTITRQLEFVKRYIEAGPAAVIGSSLGGYLAALLAARHANVSRIVLLAPAFDFHRLWVQELGPERLSAWRRSGVMDFYHYGSDRQLPLRYDLLEDAQSYEPFPDFWQPALLLHGERDPVVPVSLSERFVASHPNARLVRLPSGHELTDVLEDVWAHVEGFIAAA